jgi:hypothetical protein
MIMEQGGKMGAQRFLNNLTVGKKIVVGMYSNEQFTTWKIIKRETTVIITRTEANNRKPPQQKK